jgi:signal transduction histidine kinase
MRWTLNRKLILMMTCLCATVVILMVVLNIYFERALMKAVERKTVELTEAVHLAIEEIMKSEERDYMKLYNQLKKLQPEGVKEIDIIDGATRVKASTNPLKIGETTPEKITELIFKSEMGQFVTAEGNLYHIVLPIVARGEHQGYIHMIVSTEDLAMLLRSHTRNRLIATLIVFILGAAVAVWLSSRYTKPIRDVVKSVESVASGDLDVQLPVNESDEIGVLKRSFNEMTRRLAEFRRLEERLRQTEHLSTIGELSRTLAHELRNPLNFINLTVDHLISRCEDKNREELLKSVKEEIKRLDHLVNNFLTYGRPLKLKKRPIELVELIRDTLSLVQAKAEKQGIKIERDYEILGFLNIDADPELLKTCLLNVFQNSLQAMDNGGRMSIKVDKKEDSVHIIISDTGEGVEPEVEERVFEPFFTTKPEGVGLGLAMTKRVIEEHGGRVEFRSSRGVGTTVTLILPLDRGSAEVE